MKKYIYIEQPFIKGCSMSSHDLKLSFFFYEKVVVSWMETYISLKGFLF